MQNQSNRAMTNLVNQNSSSSSSGGGGSGGSSTPLQPLPNGGGQTSSASKKKLRPTSLGGATSGKFNRAGASSSGTHKSHKSLDAPPTPTDGQDPVEPLMTPSGGGDVTSFPTPMEEPKKVIRGKFLGAVQVDKPCGIDVIHGAIDLLMNSTAKSEWRDVTVAVAPSTVTVSFDDEADKPIECRVRFLSFLGIGEDSRQAAFIMHTAQDTFVAHAFHCEPSAGTLCRTIEAACKLRYQKCLDARPQQPPQQQSTAGQRSKAAVIGATIKNMWGSWKSGGGRGGGVTSPPS